MKHNFIKLTDTKTFGMPYDYSSVMHHGINSFAKEKNLRTISPLKKDAPEMGYWPKLSEGDITITNLLYNCPSKFLYLIYFNRRMDPCSRI